MSKRALQIKVGILVTVSFLILGAFIFILGNYSFGSGFNVYVDFDFVGNLTAGAPVKIAGIKMGRVESIEFMGGKYDENVKRRVFVRVKLWVNDKARESVRTDSKVYINTQGILGEQYVEIEPGNMDSPESTVLDADFAPLKGEAPPRSDLVISKLYTFLDEISSLLVSEKDNIKKTLKNSSKTLESVTRILDDNETQIQLLLKNGNMLVKDVNKSVKLVNKSLGDGKKIEKSLNSLNYLLAYLSGKLPLLVNNINSTLTKVDGKLDLVGEKERDKLMSSLDQLSGLSDKAKLLVQDSRGLLKNVAQGKGSIGALVVKREVYEDLKELVRDLRENPWKLFWKD
jgi:phospholipid/cholesterol/gamma-HCH transport system substrate-binding protein